MMARPFLTVLTAPLPSNSRRWYQAARRRIRPFVKPGAPLPMMSRYPGHYALVRSVVEGLQAIGADFNFNPRRVRDLGRAVYAPENAALRQAAAFKREGRIEYLAAGPVHPDELEAALPVLLRVRWAVQADRSARRLATDTCTDGAGEVLRRARAALESDAG